MRNLSHILGTTIAVTLLAGPGTASAQNLDLSDTGVLMEGIAAIVNDGVVLLSELDEQTMMIVRRLQEENTQLPPRDILIQQILERLVMTRL